MHADPLYMHIPCGDHKVFQQNLVQQISNFSGCDESLHCMDAMSLQIILIARSYIKASIMLWYHVVMLENNPASLPPHS